MGARLRVAVLFGGRSGEHEVSVVSAASVFSALDPERFEAIPVGVTKGGRWLLVRDLEAVRAAGRVEEGAGTPLAVVPGAGRAALVAADGSGAGPGPVDVAFPVLHGPNGEDGTVQGLLRLAGLPCVGSGVLGSALGMDKAAMKDVFRQHGLPVVDWALVRRGDWERDREATLARLEAEIGYPCFVKPANLGSSVGVSKARDRAGLARALDLAARYDRRLVVERAVDARELECSVLGNDDPVASVPGEIVPAREFYDYEAKYADERTRLLIPAPVGPDLARQVQGLAVRAFLALDCAGFARVDFFLERGSGRLWVNEVNTIPGFTAVSMYPKLWEASGLPYRDLVTRLVELALERWREEERSAPGD